MYNELKNSLDCLRQVVSEGFVKLHTDLDRLRFEFKAEIDAVKLSIKDIEKSLTLPWSQRLSFTKSILPWQILRREPLLSVIFLLLRSAERRVKKAFFFSRLGASDQRFASQISK